MTEYRRRAVSRHGGLGLDGANDGDGDGDAHDHGDQRRPMQLQRSAICGRLCSWSRDFRAMCPIGFWL